MPARKVQRLKELLTPHPTVTGVLAVSWPFLASIAVLALLAIFAVDALSAAHAFAGRESLWSKGEKEAVMALDRYVRSGEEPEHSQFRRRIATGEAAHLGEEAFLVAMLLSALGMSIAGVLRTAALVSRNRAAAVQLSYRASHDSLTGLINRREFERLVSDVLEKRGGAPRDNVLLFLDLDQFKVINDTCGHAAGDELLCRVGARLAESLRSGDVLARLGGDEFGILLRGCRLENALRVAEKLRQAIADFRFVCVRGSFSIGVCFGVVNLDEGFREYSEVFAAADRACYLAKEYGRNRVQVYQTSDEELARRHGMMLWVGRIRTAIDENRFRLYAQRIAPTAETRRAPLRAEVLLRMVDRDGKVIPPLAFMPAAERYDLGPAVDRWVIRNAFEQLAEAGSAAFDTCSINLGAASICDERLFDFIVQEQGRCGLRAQQICFEITETSAITQFAKAFQLIEKLRAVGFHFALDDFGTGASSFAYLKVLPVDYVKIDGIFVRDILSNRINCAMVEAIHHVAHVMGILTVAEFVENTAILERLRQVGVDFVQGYGIGKPKPLKELFQRSMPTSPAGDTLRLALPS